MDTDMKYDMRMRLIIIIFMSILILLGMVISAYSQGITNNGGYITDAGTSAHSYIKFSGSGDMTLKSTTADRTVLGNVDVDFTGSGTYKLTIPSDSYITVNGNLALSDSLLLEANSSGNMASLITNGTVTGPAIVQQHIVQDQWHMVSSPVSAAQSGVYMNCYLYKWNETDTTWSTITSTTETLSVTKGYHLWSSSTGSTTGPSDVVFTGVLNTGNYSPAITYTGNGYSKGDGWNELGNPYPSALEWNSSWSKTNVDATMYIYTGTQYKSYNYNTGLGGLPNGEIPPTQGFWIKANAANPSITIPNAERVHSSNTFYKSSVSIDNLLTVNITGNGFADETTIGTFSGSTSLFDSELDAYKLMGDEAAPQLYTIAGDTRYSVNIFPELGDEKHIPIGFRSGAQGTYTMTFEGIENFNPQTAIYLEDKLAGATLEDYIDLRQTGEYAFYADKGIDEDRFVLHFFNSMVNTGSQDINNEIAIYSFGKAVYVNYQMYDNAVITVYDMMGKQVVTKHLAPNTLNTVNVPGEKGHYIAKVISGDRVITRKVFIN